MRDRICGGDDAEARWRNRRDGAHICFCSASSSVLRKRACRAGFTREWTLCWPSKPAALLALGQQPHTHTHIKQGHQGQSVGGYVWCVCVWYSGLDLTWMHRAKEQLCRNVCTLLFNFAPLCLSISAFSAIKRTLHPSLSSLICPSNPAFHPLSRRLPPYPLEPRGLIVLQEAQSRGV